MGAASVKYRRGYIGRDSLFYLLFSLNILLPHFHFFWFVLSVNLGYVVYELSFSYLLDLVLELHHLSVIFEGIECYCLGQRYGIHFEFLESFYVHSILFFADFFFSIEQWLSFCLLMFCVFSYSSEAWKQIINLWFIIKGYKKQEVHV